MVLHDRLLIRGMNKKCGHNGYDKTHRNKYKFVEDLEAAAHSNYTVSKKRSFSLPVKEIHYHKIKFEGMWLK